MCILFFLGMISDELNDFDYISNLVMGYGDNSLVFKLFLKKKAWNEYRICRF